MNYTSGSGLKVAEPASNVGQGWHLQIGGSVSRIQSGEPDDQKPRDGNFNDITKYPPGYLYDPTRASDGCPNNLTEYPIFHEKNIIYKPYNVVTADKELDRFAFEINGRSGLFFLPKNNGNKAMMLGDSKMKIWYTQNENMPNIRTTIDAFYIQDENGIIYKFTNLELGKVLKLKFCDANANYQLEQPEFTDGNVYHESNFDDGSLVNPFVVNGWMLTEMEDAITHRKILFNYITRYINTSSGINLAAYSENSYSTMTHLKTISQSPEISSITYPDGHTVTINYGDNRIDFNGQNVIKSLDVQYGGRYISKYELNTQYFIGNRVGTPISDYQKSIARLCLTSVRKIGVDLKSDDVPYKFDYYTGSSAPDDIVPPLFYYKKDIWGYYNGSNSQGFHGQTIGINKPLAELDNDEVFGLCFIRNGGNSTVINPKNGYAKNGLLKRIQYPTGGSLKYEYEQNTGVLNGQNAIVGGVHVSKSITSDDGNNYNCDATNLTTNYKYTAAEGSTQSSYWGVENPTNVFKTGSEYQPRNRRYRLSIHGCGIYGCCKFKYTQPGILSRDQIVDLNGHAKFMEALSNVLDILNIVTTVLDIVNVALGSTGVGAIVAVAIDAFVGYVVLIYTCFRPIEFYRKFIWNTVYYNSDLNNNQLPMQYSRVEVSESSGQNGKTVMEYTSPSDYPIWETTNPALSNKQRYAYWAYGLLKKTTVYNANAGIVKQSENEYDYQFARHNDTEIYGADGIPQTVPLNGASCKCLVKNTKSNRADFWMDPGNSDNDPANYTKNMTSNPNLLADIYYMSTGRVELRNTIERVYSTTGNNQYVESKTKYDYGRNFIPSVVTTTQSNGDINTKGTVYSGDTWAYYSNQGAVLNTLISNNVLNLPVATRTTVTKSSNNIAYDLGETVTDYGYSAYTTGDIKPLTLFTKRYATPTPVSYGNAYYHGPLATDNPTYKTLKSFSYDTDNNLSTLFDFEQSIWKGYLYDYNDKYIIATVIGAAGSMIDMKERSFYTSFETDKGNGWDIIGTANYIDNAGATGKRVFGLNGSNALNAYNLNSGNPYRLTFWSTTSVTVTSTAGRIPTLVTTGPTINGFTFYEYAISYATQSNVVEEVKVSGNGMIDELRLYKADARMRTTTYDPIIGKTSECDDNNRITYYEYDEKGRIRFVKDEKRNVVKMYEYNNATKQPINCAGQGQPPVVYTNMATSEIFTKYCKPPYVGTQVTYTVPANTYTSTISQEVVDAMVQQNILANGQAYADANGTCIITYGNIAVSGTFQKQDCPAGFKGTTITYTVAANHYFSTVSQASANALAMAEVNANGQAFANSPGNADCVIDTDPDWQGVEPEQSQCGSGSQAGHQLVLCIDLNPNSPTYNTTQWTDAGPNTGCGGTVVSDIDISYTNVNNVQVTAKFKNLSSNITYVFQLAPNTTASTVVGSLAPGNYEVKINLPYGSNAQHITVYGNTQTGLFYASPVTLNSGGGTTIVVGL